MPQNVVRFLKMVVLTGYQLCFRHFPALAIENSVVERCKYKHFECIKE